MKNTLKKRAFISAIAMLVVSAIVLTSSTFAWFSMATRVEVETMQLNITSPDGVQLSANASAFTTKLTVDDLKGKTEARWAAYKGNQNNFPELLAPSSSNLQIVSSALPEFFEASINDRGFLNATRVASDVGSGYVVFDIFVKVATDMPIYFNKTTVTCADNEDVPAAMRIGVLNCGTVNPKAEASEILSKIPTGNTEVVMYEPDKNNHTEASGYADGATGVTDRYVTGEFANMTPSGEGKNITDHGSFTKTTYCNRASNVTPERACFNAVAGINRIRVYLWMEGNDVDCENSVAGSTIDFNLVLSMYQS